MLTEVNEFKTDEQFAEIKQIVYGLVKMGELSECGLNPKDPWHFVEVFRSKDGIEWHMAVPDHAFRGYLKKVH